MRRKKAIKPPQPHIPAPAPPAKRAPYADAQDALRPRHHKDKRFIRGRANHIRVTMRQSDAMRLRAAGLSYDVIAQRAGYHDASGARKAVLGGLANLLLEPAEDLRKLETARLDYLIAAHWVKAVKGDIHHTRMVAKLIDLQARINHLFQDAPEINIHPSGDVTVNQTQQNIAALLVKDPSGAMAYMRALAPPGNVPASPQSSKDVDGEVVKSVEIDDEDDEA